MPRISRTVVMAAVGGLSVLLAGCAADDPAPLPTAPSGSTTSTTGRITIRYFGDDGATGLILVAAGGQVLGKTRTGQASCTLDPAAYTTLAAAAATITAKDRATPGLGGGGGDSAPTPTLGTDVGAVSLLDPRVVTAADTVNQLIADVAAAPSARTVCT